MNELLNGLDLLAAAMTISALGYLFLSKFWNENSESVESTIKRSLMNQIVLPR